MKDFKKYEIVDIFTCILESLGITGYLVGGAVRDVYLGVMPLDFDFVSEINEEKHFNISKEIALKLKCKFEYNDFYHTAKFYYKSQDIDFVMARKEIYTGIASKPIVRSSNIYDDLKRRDFSINSMAVMLKKDGFTLLDPFCGMADILNRKIRIMHDESFKDDPTRIFRGIKYAARFGFSFEEHTERKICEAIKNGYVSALKQERIRQEIEILLNEDNAFDAMKFMHSLAILNELVKEDIHINIDLNKNKFIYLNNNDKLIVLLYKNPINIIYNIKEYLGLSQGFISGIIKLKELEDILKNCDETVYSFLFSSYRSYKDEILEILYENDTRIINYIKYKNYIMSKPIDLKGIKEKDRSSFIAGKRAEMMIDYINGGYQDV